MSNKWGGLFVFSFFLTKRKCKKGKKLMHFLGVVIKNNVDTKKEECFQKELLSAVEKKWRTFINFPCIYFLVPFHLHLLSFSLITPLFSTCSFVFTILTFHFLFIFLFFQQNKNILFYSLKKYLNYY